jgi:hypothetical protein
MTATHLDGGCRCGAVRFRASAPPLVTMACHCTGCQRMTASAFSLSAAIPVESFALLQGAPVPGALRGEHRHMHCPQCMSWVYTHIAGMDWFVNVRATMFDDARWTKPFVETATDEKLAWVKTPAVHSFAGFPTDADFPPILAAFPAWLAANA